MDNYLNELNHNEAIYLWKIANKKGLLKKSPPANPLPFPIILDFLQSCPYDMLVLAAAGDGSHMAYTVMEKLIAKPVYICARGETGMEILDDRNRPIITPRGGYRGINPLTPFGVAREYQKKFRSFKAAVDNRIVVSTTPNPKKPGSVAHKHFDQYVIGKSVTWNILNTEITRADFRYDEKKGFVTVVAPAEYQQLRLVG